MACVVHMAVPGLVQVRWEYSLVWPVNTWRDEQRGSRPKVVRLGALHTVGEWTRPTTKPLVRLL